MTQLKRLSEAPGARGAWARVVLAEESWPEPPPDAQEAIWRNLAAALPLAASVSAPSAGGPDGLTTVLEQTVGSGASAPGAGAAGTAGATGTAGAAGTVGAAGTGGALVKLSSMGAVGKILAASVVTLGGTTAGWWLTQPASGPPVTGASSSGVGQGPAGQGKTTEHRWRAPGDIEAPVSDPAGSIIAETQPSRAVRDGPEVPTLPASSAAVEAPRRSDRLPSRATFPDSAPVASSPSLPSIPRASKSELLAESAVLAEARTALRRGALSEAAQHLERHRARYPSGRLIQERDALAIELLWRTGNTAAARQRLMDYARHFPTSPHTTRLRQLMENDRELPIAK